VLNNERTTPFPHSNIPSRNSVFALDHIAEDYSFRLSSRLLTLMSTHLQGNHSYQMSSGVGLVSPVPPVRACASSWGIEHQTRFKTMRQELIWSKARRPHNGPVLLFLPLCFLPVQFYSFPLPVSFHSL
jgi:hypothetical protein